MVFGEIAFVLTVGDAAGFTTGIIAAGYGTTG